MTLALLLSAAVIAAAETEATPAEEEAEKDYPYMYMMGYIGYLGGSIDSSQLDGDEAGFAIGTGFAERWKRHFALEAEIFFLGRSYETPEGLLFAKDEMTVASMTMLVNFRAIVPFWKLEPYVAVGLGPALSELDVESTQFPGFSAENRLRVGYAAQWMVGVDFMYTRRSGFGLQYRDIYLEADFGNISRGTIQIGGRAILLSVKVAF